MKRRPIKIWRENNKYSVKLVVFPPSSDSDLQTYWVEFSSFEPIKQWQAELAIENYIKTLDKK